MHPDEARDRRVGAGELSVLHAGEQVAVALPPDGRDEVHLGEARQQIVRECLTIPVVDRYRPNLLLEELAKLFQASRLLRVEQLLVAVEVAVGVRKTVG